MQLTVALGAVVIGAYSARGTSRLFILAPLLAIYFTALILYSYRIHDMLAGYLREEIEPEFQELTELPATKEWEIWYRSEGRRPGVRRWFFVAEMWIVTVAGLGFLWHQEWSVPGQFQLILACATLAYPALMMPMTILGLRKRESKNRGKHS
jgi:hypothetical protein